MNAVVQVALFVPSGASPLDVAIVAEALRLAGGYRLRHVGEHGRPTPTAVPALWFHPDTDVCAAPEPVDTLVVLGGGRPPSPEAQRWLEQAGVSARRRLTAAGGAQTLAAMLDLIAQDRGPAVRVGAAMARSPLSQPSEPGIARVLDHIRADPAAPHRVAELARRAAMSDRSFARAFRAITGVGAAAYVRQVRVAHARHLLDSTDLPIGRVLHLSGFATPGAGRRAFEQAEGVGPSRYRQRASG